MKKLILVFLAALAIVSCQKKENQPTPPATQDVTFSVTDVTPDLKSTDDWICVDNVPDHAWIRINDGVTSTDYYPELFELDGQLYTQAIKLPEMDNLGYCIEVFILYDEIDGNPGYQNTDEFGDVIVFGTPTKDTDLESGYDIYVQWPLTECFSVDAFTKVEKPMEVLCFQPADYEKFGFDWFAVTEIVIREQCFFGDFCMKHPYDYILSDYQKQAGFPQTPVPFWDAPAIVSIDVFKVTQSGDVPVAYSPFTNNTAEAGYGVGGPVCIQYPDNLSIDGEEFKVVLNILVKQGDAFVFLPFYEWTFFDEDMIPTMNVDETIDDGVVDFVLGSCNLSNTNVQLAPYQNLPVSVYMDIQHPGTQGYWNFTVESVSPAGNYDFGVGSWIGFCADNGTTIGEGKHTFYAFSSLYPNSWPTSRPSYLAADKLNRINWIFNHLEDYGFSMTTMTKADGLALQDAIWKLLQNIGPGNQYSVDAAPHGNFMPLPGGWAAVLLFTNDDNGQYVAQLLLTQVDP